MELIFINKAQCDEARNCYRVLDIPHCENGRVIFDSCIYPQEPNKEQKSFLKLPDTSHELMFCAEAHLKREYDNIEQCEIEDINQVCDKIISVYFSSFTAKKANIKDYKGMAFYDADVSEV